MRELFLYKERSHGTLVHVIQYSIRESLMHHSVTRAATLLLCLGAGLAHAQALSEFDQLLAKATTGDAQAQWKVATAYDWGHGVERSDAEAKRWYRAAAEQGYAEAQNR